MSSTSTVSPSSITIGLDVDESDIFFNVGFSSSVSFTELINSLNFSLLSHPPPPPEPNAISSSGI